MIQAIVIEDEELIADLLMENLRQIPFIRVVASHKTAIEAIESLQQQEVDLIFLDVHLPGLSGLRFLQSLNNPPRVIMVTAYQEYAVEAFELNVVDYILKPFSFERVLKACQKAFAMINNTPENRPVRPDMSGYFFVNSEYALVRIRVDEILFIEGMKDYIKIHLSSTPRPVITRMTLKSVQEKLPFHAFARTHKSFVVALSKITAIKRDFVCIEKSQVPLSESFRNDIMHYVHQIERPQ